MTSSCVHVERVLAIPVDVKYMPECAYVYATVVYMKAGFLWVLLVRERQHTVATCLPVCVCTHTCAHTYACAHTVELYQGF